MCKLVGRHSGDSLCASLEQATVLACKESLARDFELEAATCCGQDRPINRRQERVSCRQSPNAPQWRISRLDRCGDYERQGISARDIRQLTSRRAPTGSSCRPHRCFQHVSERSACKEQERDSKRSLSTPPRPRHCTSRGQKKNG